MNSAAPSLRTLFLPPLTIPSPLSQSNTGQSSYKKMVATGMLDVNAVAAGGYNTLYSLADGSAKEKVRRRVRGKSVSKSIP